MKNVRFFRYRACFETIYSLGLRVGEGTRLQICDIDSARMVVHVRNGKGGKDRYVPLPRRTLQLLRELWLIHRNESGCFPGLAEVVTATTAIYTHLTGIAQEKARVNLDEIMNELP